MSVQDNQPRPLGLRSWQHVAIFLLASTIVVLRRPDELFHAQLYAEDGHVWFAEAYNYGWWPALLRTWAGYIQTLPRLTASFALLVPLCRVPILFSLIAIPIQALPVNLLLFGRSSGWGCLRFRALLAAVYLALPNSSEISVGITNSQWILALCAFIVLVAVPPISISWRILDGLVLVMCGLTGPFCVLLLPVAILLALKNREHWRRVQIAILFCCSAIQAEALLFIHHGVRSHLALGASLILFLRILGSQIYLATLLGENALSAWPGSALTLVLSFVAVAGTGLVVVCFVRSDWELRLFLLFAAMLLAASLISPFVQLPPNSSAWAALAGTPGGRYWYFPTLAFAWTLLWGVQQANPTIKRVSAVLIVCVCFGVIRDWRHPAFTDMHWQFNVRRFEAAPAGTSVSIPIYPNNWEMTLVKHH